MEKNKYRIENMEKKYRIGNIEKTKYRQHNNIEKRDEQIRNVVSAHVYTDNDDISQFLNSISQFLLIN